MSADDISGMKANLNALVREQADRRALRDQRGEELKARSHEYMTKQVQAAERYVQHRRELGQRKTKSGWSTDRTGAEAAAESAFEAEKAAAPPITPTSGPTAPARPVRTRRPRAAEVDDEDDAFLNNRWRD
jgi:hypothetical protein